MPALDPAVRELGIVARPDIPGPTAAIALIVGLMVVLALAGRVPRLARMAGLGAGFALLALAAFAATVPSTFTTWAYGPGARVLPPGDDDAAMPVFTVLAGPGEQFSIAIGITHRGPLPVTITGVVVQDPPPHLPAWTAVWLDASPSFGLTRPDRHFAAVPAPADGAARPALWLVGTGGSCSVGASGGRAQAPGDAAGSVSLQVQLSYDVLGWPREAYVDLPFLVAAPMIEGCSSNAAAP